MSFEGGIFIGISRPLPDVTGFVTPIFSATDGTFVVQKVVEGRIVAFEMVDLAEDFLPLHCARFVQIGDPALYGMEFEDCISMGPAIQALAEQGVTVDSAVEDGIAAIANILEMKCNHPSESFSVFRSSSESNKAGAVYTWERVSGIHLVALAAEAVATARRSMASRDSAENPLGWALAQRNFSGAVTVLCSGSSVREVSSTHFYPHLFIEAVNACRSALLVLDASERTIDWAVTKMNLGDALRNLFIYSSEDSQRSPWAVSEVRNIYVDVATLFENEIIPSALSDLRELAWCEVTKVMASRSTGAQFRQLVGRGRRLLIDDGYREYPDRSLRSLIGRPAHFRDLIGRYDELVAKKRRREISFATFPVEIDDFLRQGEHKEQWEAMSYRLRRRLLSLGCKLEPIVQVAPSTEAPAVLGFVCLPLTESGEKLADFSWEYADIDQPLIWACMAIAAIKTLSLLRSSVESTRETKWELRARFFVSLDSELLVSRVFENLLDKYRADFQDDVFFRIFEQDAQRLRDRLIDLHEHYGLKYLANHVGDWDIPVHAALADKIEATVVDCRSFASRLDVNDVSGVLRKLRRNAIAGKPLVVEAASDSNFIHFLRRHWNHEDDGPVYAQGYDLDVDIYWRETVLPAEPYGKTEWRAAMVDDKAERQRVRLN